VWDNIRDNIRNNIRNNIKSNGSGQECPLHTI
jgi:hypothetical protein